MTKLKRPSTETDDFRMRLIRPPLVKDDNRLATYSRLIVRSNLRNVTSTEYFTAIERLGWIDAVVR